MFADSLEPVAEHILSGYRLASSSRMFLGNAGGFSGAKLWKVDSAFGSFCLKAWPQHMPAERLRQAHHYMAIARGNGLRFVPEIRQTHGNDSIQIHAGRVWDLTEWMPGRADFYGNPSIQRIQAACLALAQLHDVWSRHETQTGLCPAVHRRLAALSEWQALLDTNWRPNLANEGVDSLSPLAKRAWNLLLPAVSGLPKLLRRFADVSMPLHPCVCDIWHDHVLFDGDRISGVIDYGSMRIDSPATDLARLVGSLAGDDEALFAAGMSAYESIRGRATPDADLVRLLDISGWIIALTQWLRWLYHDNRHFDSRDRVAERLEELVARLERRHQARIV